jgi:hypothetical protein
MFLPLEIPRRNALCDKGQEPIKAGMEYYSVLIEDANREWKRLDYCSVCWKNECGDSFLKQAKVQWKSKRQSKEEVTTGESADALEMLKERLQLDTEESRQEAFILALFLARDRQIVLRKEIEEENLLFYEAFETEEIFPVRKIKLNHLDIVKLKNSIEKKLASSAKKRKNA